MNYIGIDVHKNSCQVCVLTEDGELIERRIKTDRSSLHALFSNRPRARILIESSTESEWVARCLEGLGHEVIVADPNYAPMYAQRNRRVKTDRRDAEAHSVAIERPTVQGGTHRREHLLGASVRRRYRGLQLRRQRVEQAGNRLVEADIGDHRRQHRAHAGIEISLPDRGQLVEDQGPLAAGA